MKSGSAAKRRTGSSETRLLTKGMDLEQGTEAIQSYNEAKQSALRSMVAQRPLMCAKTNWVQN